MDPRDSNQRFFTRPSSQPAGCDVRNIPVPPPPPPYTLQAPPRPQTFFNNDIFLARKDERDEQLREHQQKSGLPVQAPFDMVSYATGMPRKIPASGEHLHEMQHESVPSWRRFEDGRMDRYGAQAMDAPSALPPPPPSSSSFRPSFPPSTPAHDSARPGAHRSSSPRMYGAQNHSAPLPPPPPPFAGRHMLPPSPPQYNTMSASREQPPPSPYGNGRDLPAPSASTRPGSSMSISAMLGTDTARPNRDPPASPYASGMSANTLFPSSHQHSSSSPAKSTPGGNNRHIELAESQNSIAASANRFRAYSGGTPPSWSPVKAGVGGSRFAALPQASSSQISPTSADPAQQVWKPLQIRDSSIGGLINRPSSQPSDYISTSNNINRRAQENARREEQARQEHEIAQRAGPRTAPSDHGSTFDFLGQKTASATHETSTPSRQPMKQHSPQDDRLHTSSYPLLSKASIFSEPPSSVPPPEMSPTSRLGAHDANLQVPLHKTPWAPEALRRLREERLGATESRQQGTASTPTGSQPRFLEVSYDRDRAIHPVDTKHPLQPAEMNRSASLDQAIQQIKNSNDTHRGSLAAILENSKRAGRFSPMPQAVQGAQGQRDGPSRDPTIKNEWSKMFGGIGSGVSSSGLAGSGASTPFPPSPKPSESEQRPTFAGRNDLIEMSKSRSRSTKKSRKVKDDDTKEGESRNGTEHGNTKGIKRSKHSHHVHQLGHHHHHYHRRLEDDTGTPLRTASNPTSATNVPHHHHHPRHHHHHHPDGTIHYHHSKTPAAAPAIPKPAPPRIPTITINNSPLEAATQHLPRRHLGSVLYSPTLEAPTGKTSPATTKSPRASGQYVIPRCDGKANCTLTVRIPRFYLANAYRESVCARRAVWGAGVYTDDSDPLAAAVHAGWVRGAWGEGIEARMLEVGSDDNLPTSGGGGDNKSGSGTGKDDDDDGGPAAVEVLTRRPHSPVLPFEGRDLHLTLVILPPLAQYAGTVVHGIRSRGWGGDHDGMSFRVEAVRWVSPAAGSGEERGGEARRRRLSMVRRKSVFGVGVALRGAGGKVRLGGKRGRGGGGGGGIRGEGGPVPIVAAA